jgi:dTDP-4-amino-4,6-dideoxygalactose transaminase
MLLSADIALKMILDDCQVLGVNKEKKADSLGDAGCLSYYYSNIFEAYGESGMVITNLHH